MLRGYATENIQLIQPNSSRKEVLRLRYLNVDEFQALGAGLGVGVGKLTEMRLDQRVNFEVDRAEKLGIDITDLYYDFDLPGDQYPFGDGGATCTCTPFAA